ncbi:MAG: hypothetical protein AB7O43_08465 [Hyphomicrobiaceae bacterium]
MPIIYACAASHAPGITAWTEAAPEQQSAAVKTGFASLAQELASAAPDTVLVLTSEHWANFFLDHASAFCIGRGETFAGPVEPWLRVERRSIMGNPALAARILEHCYANGFEPSHSHELEFDHGTMVPLSFLTPDMDRKVVPIFFNTLAAPRPTPQRCLALGQMLRPALDAAPERIAIIATGGLSHDPGEVNHGVVDTEFDADFLRRMESADLDALAEYSDAELLAAGAGTLELLAWICLAGIMGASKPATVAYQAVKPWATGVGMISYGAQDAERKAA